MSKNRFKRLSIRVTEDEYNDLLSYYLEYGRHSSLSNFVREILSAKRIHPLLSEKRMREKEGPNLIREMESTFHQRNVQGITDFLSTLQVLTHYQAAITARDYVQMRKDEGRPLNGPIADAEALTDHIRGYEFDMLNGELRPLQTKRMRKR